MSPLQKENLMKTGRIRFGCQTYTWQMSFEKYRGKIEHIIATVKASGKYS